MNTPQDNPRLTRAANPAKVRKIKSLKDARAKKAAPASQKQLDVPILLEFTITISQLVVLLVGVVIAVISILAKLEVIWIVLRSGIAMLGLGLLLWFANWFLAHDALDYAFTELKKEVEQEAQQANENDEIYPHTDRELHWMG